MSKEKKLRRIVLDKLYHKNDAPLKKSTRSNAPTESTPNEVKHRMRFTEQFFENFDTECAIIYEPVKLSSRRPELKRNIEDELLELYSNNFKNNPKDHQSRQRYSKLNTETMEKNQPFSKNSQREETQRSRNKNYGRIMTEVSENIKQKQIFENFPSSQNSQQMFAINSPIFHGMKSPCNNSRFSQNKPKNESMVPSTNYCKNKHSIKSIQRMQKDYEKFSKNCSSSYKNYPISKSQHLKYAPKKQGPIILGENQRLKRVQSMKQMADKGRKTEHLANGRKDHQNV